MVLKIVLSLRIILTHLKTLCNKDLFILKQLIIISKSKLITILLHQPEITHFAIEVKIHRVIPELISEELVVQMVHSRESILSILNYRSSRIKNLVTSSVLKME